MGACRRDLGIQAGQPGPVSTLLWVDLQIDGRVEVLGSRHRHCRCVDPEPGPDRRGPRGALAGGVRRPDDQPDGPVALGSRPAPGRVGWLGEGRPPRDARELCGRRCRGRAGSCEGAPTPRAAQAPSRFTSWRVQVCSSRSSRVCRSRYFGSASTVVTAPQRRRCRRRHGLTDARLADEGRQGPDVGDHLGTPATRYSLVLVGIGSRCVRVCRNGVRAMSASATKSAMNSGDVPGEVEAVTHPRGWRARRTGGRSPSQADRSPGGEMDAREKGGARRCTCQSTAHLRPTRHEPSGASSGQRQRLAATARACGRGLLRALRTTVGVSRPGPCSSLGACPQSPERL